MSLSRHCWLVLVAGLAARPVHAQQVPSGPPYATRDELDALVRATARRAADTTLSPAARAASIDSSRGARERLRVGDFRVGDRILVRLSGPVALVETLTVSPARTVTLPEAGEVSLERVLRAEVQDRLRAAITRVVRAEEVRAQPLVRVGVLGEARAPGFVYVPVHALLSDVLTAAGGPTINGSVAKASVRRAGYTLIEPLAFGRALASGATLADLGIQAGDEVYIDGASAVSWMQVFQTAAVVVGAATAYLALRASH